MNMYVIVPSALSSAISMGQDFIVALSLMGSSVLGAMLSLLVQTNFISNVRDDKLLSSNIANVFFAIAIMGMLGNAVVYYGISTNDYRLTIAGRILVGTTFCEPITQFVVSTSTKNNIRAASSVYFKASSVMGMILGLLIGSTVYIAPLSFQLDGYEIDIKVDTIQGLIFFSLWTFIFGYVINFCLIMPRGVTYSVDGNTQTGNDMKGRSHMDSPGSSDSPTYEEDIEGRFQDLGPFHKLHKLTEDSENTMEHSDRRHNVKATSNIRIFISNWNKAIKMTLRSASLPVCFLLLIYTSAVHEMILNSFTLTMSLHFGWNYLSSGLCLTLLALLIIPITALTFRWTEASEERLLLKVIDLNRHYYD